MMTNRELESEVLDELEWESRVRAAEIGVAVDDGVVTLTGFLDSYTEKLAADEAVKRVTDQGDRERGCRAASGFPGADRHRYRACSRQWIGVGCPCPH